MKLGFLGILMLAAIPAAFGTSITYSTVGSELCVGASGCGVASQTIGGGSGITLTFNPVATSTVDANPVTFGSFGELVVSCVGGGSSCGSQSLAGLTLTILVTQTAPDADSDSILAGSITGSISGNASSAMITWPTPNTILLGSFPIAFSVQNNPLVLVPVSSNSGVTSLQARIEDLSVPEPSTYLLLSAGLLGIGLRRRWIARKG